MSDQDQEHPEIGRRLRETGLVSAPDDLADDVMRRIRAEPRSRARHRWQPLRVRALTFALAAALLTAAVLGISRLDLGSGSGSGSGGGAKQAATQGSAEGRSTSDALASPSSSPYRQFTVGAYALRRLATGGSHPFLYGVPLKRVKSGFELYAPDARYARVAAALARAAAEFSAADGAPGSVTVRLYHLHR
ncbi:MAG: hypothetical protein ACXVY5_01125 [Gaiellales bacterium]